MNPPAPDASAPAGRRLADVPHSGPAASRPIAGPPIGVRERRDRAMGWRTRDVARAAVIVLGIYLLGRLLWFANSLVFVVFLGTLFGLAVAGAVDRLERFRIRRGIASALIVFGTLAALVGVGALMAPTLTEQFGELRKQIPAAVDRMERWVAEHPNSLVSTGLRGWLQSPTPDSSAAGAARAGATRTGAAATRTQAGAPATTTAPAGTTDTAAARTAQVAADAAAQAASSTAQQLGGQASAPAATSGAPSATAGLRSRLGSQLAGATRFLFPFLSSVGTVTAGLVLIIFLAIYIGAEPTLYHGGMMHLFPHRARNKAGEVLENNLLIPWLMRGGMDLPPALTLVAQALMTLVFGFLGLMVAVPLTAAVLVPIKLLWVRDTIGDDIEVRDDEDDDDDDADGAGQGRDADKVGATGPRKG
jgi:predicted PurR-regulated permease PerM